MQQICNRYATDMKYRIDPWQALKLKQKKLRGPYAIWIAEVLKVSSMVAPR